jgi:multiple sugar transport system substrate-binding protein
LNPNKPPSTWAQFLADAIQLKKHGIYATGWLGAPGNDATWNWADFLFSQGGAFFDARNRPIFDNAAGVQSLTWLVDLLRKYQVMPPSVTSWGYDQLNNNFVHGQVAMVVDWPYLLGMAQDPRASSVVGKVKIAVVPSNGQHGVPGGEWKWIVPYDTTHRAAAIQFVKFFTSPEFENYQAVKYALLPARSAVYDNLQKAHPSYQWAVWRQTFTQGTRWMPVAEPNWPAVSDTISYAIQRVELGRAPASVALHDAAVKVAKLVH